MKLELWMWGLIWAGCLAATSVTISAPNDGQIFSASNVSIQYLPAAETALDNCSLATNATGDWTLEVNQTAVSNGTQNTVSKNFSDGFYLIQLSCSANQTVFTSSNKTLRIDTTAPSAILNLAASVNGTAVNVSWNASQDASALTYSVSRNGTNVANVSATFYTESINTSQSYNYTVKAVDQANFSSSTASVVTTATTATPTPSAMPSPTPVPTLEPNGLTLGPINVTVTGTSATFSWSIISANTTANASVAYHNASGVLGIVSNPSLATSHTLSIAGLSPFSTYSANVTSCNATACASNNSIFFSTLATSYPTALVTSVNTTQSGAYAGFFVTWADNLSLSYYIVSHNESGVMTNQTPVPFNASTTSVFGFFLGTNTHTLDWQVWANNSQGAFGVSPLREHLIAPVVATPVPITTPIPILTAASTPVPTVAPTAQPTVAPTPQPAKQTASSASTTDAATVENAINQALNKENQTIGSLNEFALVPGNEAESLLGATGLVVAVDTPNATLRFTANFTNDGVNRTVGFNVTLQANNTPVAESNSTIQNASANQTMVFNTEAVFLPAGQYRAEGTIFDATTGRVLQTQAFNVDVQARGSKENADDQAPLAGLLFGLLGIGGFLTVKLHASMAATE